MNDQTGTLSPLMRQYHEIKNQYPQELVLFQVGDFYELFYDDAIKASAFLGITLTKRNGQASQENIPFCGVPVHTVDHYVLKLIKGGYRVVVCDQLSKPQPGKLVERGVKHVLTPGTLTDVKMLDDKSASYVAALVPTGDSFGLVFIELLTGHMFATIVQTAHEKMLEAELARFLPDEIVLIANQENTYGYDLERALKKQGYVTLMLDIAGGLVEERDSWLEGTCSAGALNFIKTSPVLNTCLTLVYTYLKRHCASALDQCKQLLIYAPDDFLILDAATQRNLELVKNTTDGSQTNTLFSVMDRASTAMGSRMLKKWLIRPLIKQEHIEQRFDAVEFFVHTISLTRQLVSVLKNCGDLERIVGRIALSRANLYDYNGLTNALTLLPELGILLEQCVHVHIVSIIKTRIGDFKDLCTILQSSLNDDTQKDWLIKPGFSAELDRLRNLSERGTQAILELERKEQELTGIASLKIRFVKQYGYAFEVTKSYLHLIPDHYARTQTLTNRERFVTQELKDLEYDLQRAQASIADVEAEVFKEVCQHVFSHVAALKKCSQALATLDALLGLALLAHDNNFIRPTFGNNRDIIIKAGRHPVVEASIAHTQTTIPQSFIPNDVQLTDAESLWIITGPNMGGKSTFLRQVAVISIMAQAGSFVPATQANLAILDRIFTRIGAADNLAQGKSTFLVEMEEAALICTQATANSLVILDEVGRGTSTYDGLALAQSIIEYLYQHVKARCLFATHYHELTELVAHYPGMMAYHAASKETADGVILLHKIIAGIAQGSFGLQVAKRAGMPQPILDRAHMLVQGLKQNKSNDAQRL